MAAKALPRRPEKLHASGSPAPVCNFHCMPTGARPLLATFLVGNRGAGPDPPLPGDAIGTRGIWARIQGPTAGSQGAPWPKEPFPRVQ